MDTMLIHFLLGTCSFSHMNVYHLRDKTLFRSRNMPGKKESHMGAVSDTILFPGLAEPHGRYFHVSVISTVPASD